MNATPRSNRKSPERRGKVQLIDATKRFTPLRENLGQKNAELSDADIAAITAEFLAFTESETSKIFPNQAFGYWKVAVERPLKLRTDLDAAALARLRDAAADDPELTAVGDWLARTLGPGPHRDWNVVLAEINRAFTAAGARKTAKRLKTLRTP
jgi:type I restriction enzyme M protein